MSYIFLLHHAWDSYSVNTGTEQTSVPSNDDHMQSEDTANPLSTQQRTANLPLEQESPEHCLQTK